MVQGSGDGDIESAQGIGPPPPPATKRPLDVAHSGQEAHPSPGDPGSQSPFTPDNPQQNYDPPQPKPQVNLQLVALIC